MGSMENVRRGWVANTTRIALTDTYALETIEGGVQVRRFVSAGDPIPESYEVSDALAYEATTTENIDPTPGS